MGEFDAWMSSPNSLHPLPPSRTLPRVEGEEGQWLGRITFARMLIYSPTHTETNKLEVMGVERCFPLFLWERNKNYGFFSEALSLNIFASQ